MSAAVARWDVRLLRRVAEEELEEVGDWMRVGGSGTE